MKKMLKKTLTTVVAAALVITGMIPAVSRQVQAADTGDGVVTYRAVLIGNTYPSSSNKLPGPDNDIDNMEGFLKSLGVAYSNVNAIDNASAAQTKSAISSTLGAADADDVSLFYYSGHGKVEERSSESDGALCMYDPSNYSGIELMELSALESCLSAVKGKVVVILDSCGSGAGVVSDPYSRSVSKDADIIDSKEESDAFLNDVIDVFSQNDTGVFDNSASYPGALSKYAEFCTSGKYYVIAGCEVGTTSMSIALGSTSNELCTDYEWYSGNYCYAGALTYSILKGAGYKYTKGGGSRSSNSMAADTDSSSTLTFSETFTYAKAKVKEIADEYEDVQNVVCYPANGDNQIIFDNTNAVTISFDANGGTGSMSSVSGVEGSSCELPESEFTAPVGYHFAGWDIDGITYAPGTAYTLASDVTAKAIWEGNAYTVTFDGNGATAGTMQAQSFTVGTAQALTANAFVKDGYTFTGWNTDPNGLGTAYTDGQTVSDLTTTDGGSVTLYAQWSQKVAADGSSAGVPAATGTTLTDSSGKSTGYVVTSSDAASPTVTYTGTASSKKKTSVTIPATVTDASGNVYKVTAIADKAFANSKKLKSVTIGANVKSIGKGAFKGCKKLAKVTVNANVTTRIGKNAFKGIKSGARFTIKASKRSKAVKLLNKINKTGGAKNARLTKFKKTK